MPGDRDQMIYAVNELFSTIQGEASFTGTPAVFVRLQGCDVGCSFCDTKHTWLRTPADQRPVADVLEKKSDSPTYAPMTTEDLVATVVARAGAIRHVVITGGEPADYDLIPLTAALRRAGFVSQLETSGTSPIKVDGSTFVTVSPKIGMVSGREVLRAAIARADEIKHPTATETHLRQLLELLGRGWHRDGIPIWLQPLSQSPAATKRCVEWASQHGFRLSVQTHKFIALR